LYTFSSVVKVISDWWLGRWLQNSYAEIFSLEGYFGIYVAIAFFSTIICYIKNKFFYIFVVRSCNKYFDSLFYTIIKSPLTWFDITPKG